MSNSQNPVTAETSKGTRVRFPGEDFLGTLTGVQGQAYDTDLCADVLTVEVAWDHHGVPSSYAATSLEVAA